MRHKRMYSLCLVVLLTASLQAVPAIPDNLPDVNVSISPANPTSEDELRLIVAGQWPNGCPPQSLRLVSVIPGDSIWVDLLTPGAGQPGCTPPDCSPAISAYQINAGIGMLPPGRYDIFMRAVGCDDRTAFERVGRFEVGLPAGGGDGRPDGFAPGICVVLLEDNPLVAPGLRAGQAGTVICCDSADCSGSVLISWAFYTRGRDTASLCDDNMPVILPPGSAVWMDPDEVLLGLPFSECGVLRRGLEGCVLLEMEDGRVFNLVDAAAIDLALSTTDDIQYGDSVRVRGYINTTPPDPDIIRICPQRSGDIYQAVITLCAPAGGAGCCSANFQPGDRVVLLVNNPRGLDGQPVAGLFAGATGTVVCCDSDDPQLPVFVSWDGFIGGTNATSFCDPPILPFPQNSGLWMSCNQIARLDPGGGPGSDDGLVVKIGGSVIRLTRDTGAPEPNTFSGCTNVTLQLNFRGRLSVQVTPTLAAGGTWEGFAVPEVIGPGTSVVKICVRGMNVDISRLPPGKDIQVAEVSLFVAPVF